MPTPWEAPFNPPLHAEAEVDSMKERKTLSFAKEEETSLKIEETIDSWLYQTESRPKELTSKRHCTMPGQGAL